MRRCGPVAVRRPFDHAAPAVQGVCEHDGVSDSVHRQSVGQSCYATETGTDSAHLCRLLETPQVQCLGHVVDAPVVVQRPVPDVQTVLVDNGTGKFMAVFADYSHLLLCSLRLSPDRDATHHGRLGASERI